MNNGRVSNSFVGYNLEEIQRLLTTIEECYCLMVGEYSAGGNGVSREGNRFFEHLAEECAGMGTTSGWYSEEAVNFFNGLKTNVDELYKLIYSRFGTIYDNVRNAAIQWSQVTGESVNVGGTFATKWPLKKYDANTLIKNNIDGAKGVDPQLYDRVKKIFELNRNNFENTLNNLKNRISSTSAFLGAQQSSSIYNAFISLADTYLSLYIYAYNRASAQIKSSVDKYNTTATQVSSSFNN